MNGSKGPTRRDWMMLDDDDDDDPYSSAAIQRRDEQEDDTREEAERKQRDDEQHQESLDAAKSNHYHPSDYFWIGGECFYRPDGPLPGEVVDPPSEAELRWAAEQKANLEKARRRYAQIRRAREAPPVKAPPPPPFWLRWLHWLFG